MTRDLFVKEEISAHLRCEEVGCLRVGVPMYARLSFIQNGKLLST